MKSKNVYFTLMTQIWFSTGCTALLNRFSGPDKSEESKSKSPQVLTNEPIILPQETPDPIYPNGVLLEINESNKGPLGSQKHIITAITYTAFLAGAAGVSFAVYKAFKGKYDDSITNSINKILKKLSTINKETFEELYSYITPNDISNLNDNFDNIAIVVNNNLNKMNNTRKNLTPWMGNLRIHNRNTIFINFYSDEKPYRSFSEKFNSIFQRTINQASKGEIDETTLKLVSFIAHLNIMHPGKPITIVSLEDSNNIANMSSKILDKIESLNPDMRLDHKIFNFGIPVFGIINPPKTSITFFSKKKFNLSLSKNNSKSVEIFSKDNEQYLDNPLIMFVFKHYLNLNVEQSDALIKSLNKYLVKNNFEFQNIDEMINQMSKQILDLKKRDEFIKISKNLKERMNASFINSSTHNPDIRLIDLSLQEKLTAMRLNKNADPVLAKEVENGFTNLLTNYSAAVKAIQEKYIKLIEDELDNFKKEIQIP